MIDLVLTVCLLAAPANCRDERPQMVVDSLTACISQSQFYLVQWLSSHPGYDIRRWRCEPSAARQEPI